MAAGAFNESMGAGVIFWGIFYGLLVFALVYKLAAKLDDIEDDAGIDRDQRRP